MASNNILMLGPPGSGKIRIAQLISGDHDTSTISQESHSGLVYTYNLATKYFSAKVNLLLEEYPDHRDSDTALVELLQATYDELRSEQCAELRDAISGLIFTFDMSIPQETLEQLLGLFAKVKELFEDKDVFVVVVGTSEAANVEAVEDQIILSGFEFLNFNESGKNEFMDKLGKDRLVEIVESHDWDDVTTQSMSAEDYLKHQKEQADQMTEKLLSEEQAEVSFETMFHKLALAKEKAEGMNPEDKKAYVDKLVEEYLEYF